MSENIPLLETVRVAAPCPANWNEMVGGERVRYCRSCEKNVYNLSEMSRSEAEKLLQTHEGKMCVRYYRRMDGTIMTNNCPVGLRTIRKMYLKTAAGAAALCGVLFGGIASMGARHEPENQPQSEYTTGDAVLIPPSNVPAPPVVVPPPHLDPERGHMLGGIGALPPRFIQGKVAVHKPVTKEPPIAEVSDNTDDEDDTGF